MTELNYLNDSRNCGPAKAPVLCFYGCGTCGTPDESCDCPAAPVGVAPVCGTHFYGTDIEEKLPTKWVVCDVCDGKGTHVNPSIDCNGLTAEDFAEDPDFFEDYMSGHFDQPCNQCRGRTTVQGIDWDALTLGQRKAWEAQEREADNDRACHMAELRAGA